MQPNPELNTFIDIIRQGDLLAFEREVIDKNVDFINQSLDMNETDIQRLMHKSKKSREELVPRFTTGCTPLFFTLLYTNYDMLSALAKKGANLRAKTHGGVDLFLFYFYSGTSQRIMSFIFDSAQDMVIESGRNSIHLIRTSQGSSSFIAETQYCYDEVETLITSVHLNHPGILADCIALGTEKKDIKGSALFFALSQGKTLSVLGLKAAQVPILDKHYYGAGLAGPEQAVNLYNLIKPQEYTRNNQDRQPIPQCVLQADLKNLSETFRENPPHAVESSRWLFHVLTAGSILCARLLVENGVKIEPKHFYAAGRIHDARTQDSGDLATRHYKLLRSASNNTPLPENFYSAQENEEYRLAITNSQGTTLDFNFG